MCTRLRPPWSRFTMSRHGRGERPVRGRSCVVSVHSVSCAGSVDSPVRPRAAHPPPAARPQIDDLLAEDTSKGQNLKFGGGDLLNQTWVPVKSAEEVMQVFARGRAPTAAPSAFLPRPRAAPLGSSPACAKESSSDCWCPGRRACVPPLNGRPALALARPCRPQAEQPRVRGDEDEQGVLALARRAPSQGAPAPLPSAPAAAAPRTPSAHANPALPPPVPAPRRSSAATARRPSRATRCRCAPPAGSSPSLTSPARSASSAAG